MSQCCRCDGNFDYENEVAFIDRSNCFYPEVLEAIRVLRGVLLLIAFEHHSIACVNPAKPLSFRDCVEDNVCGLITAILKETEKWG